MSMRVLMVNKFLYPKGGAEAYMTQLARLLEGLGIESTYFGMRDNRNAAFATAPFFPSGVDFEHPSGITGRARVAGRMIWSREARSGMEALLRAERVGVAHLHNIYHQLSPSILPPLRDAGVPVVMTVHDYKLVCPVYTLTSHGEYCERCVGGHFRHVVQRRCNRGSLTGSALVGLESWVHRTRGAWDSVGRFITPSSYMRDKLIDGGYPADRIEVIRNAVDLDVPVREFHPGGDLLYAGRLSHEKGLGILLRAAGRAGLPLRIAGDGPERQALEGLARDLGSSVAFLGHLDRRRLQEEVAACRALVLPSTWPENCPMVILEAMAMGKPVVASRVGGVPELVRDGHEGLLVEQGSIDELQDALERVAGDDSLAEALGRSGRNRAVQEFSPDRHVASVVSVYRELGVSVPEAVAA